MLDVVTAVHQQQQRQDGNYRYNYGTNDIVALFAAAVFATIVSHRLSFSQLLFFPFSLFLTFV